MPSFLRRLLQRELVLDPRLRLLGLLSAACFSFHAVYNLWAAAVPTTGNLLWMCHVSEFMLSVGLLASLASWVRIASLWAIIGLPVWLIDVAARGEVLRISVLSHIVVPTVAVLALTQVRMPKRWPVTVAAAAALYVGVQHACRLFTPPELNVNLAHRMYELVGSEILSGYAEYWAVTFALLVVTLSAIAFAVRRFTPADAELDTVVADAANIEVLIPEPPPPPVVVNELGFNMAPKLSPQELREQQAAARAAAGLPPLPSFGRAASGPVAAAARPASPVAPAAKPAATSSPSAPAPSPSRPAKPAFVPQPAPAPPPLAPVERGKGLTVNRLSGPPVPEDVMNKRTRGFTLLEMMVVVAVLGIMATIAMPDLTPAIHKARIRGQTDEVTNFVERARRQARAEGRCYRISKAGTGGLIMEERTDADCFTNARINSGWNTVATLALTAPGFTLTIENLRGGTVDDKLIFRPNGRLRGDADFDTTDEGGRIVVRYAPVPNVAAIQVTPQGRLCPLSLPSAPSGPLSRRPSTASPLSLVPRPRAAAAASAEEDTMRTPRGYLLMEALIAGALVAVALTTTITLIGTSRIETTMAARRAQASALAMAKAEELLAKNAGELQALVDVGPKHPGFQWSWTVADAATVRGQSTPPIGAGKLDLIAVTVRFPTSKGPDKLTYERLRRNP